MLQQQYTGIQVSADLKLIHSDGATVVSVNALKQLAQAADLF